MRNLQYITLSIFLSFLLCALGVAKEQEMEVPHPLNSSGEISAASGSGEGAPQASGADKENKGETVPGEKDAEPERPSVDDIYKFLSAPQPPQARPTDGKESAEEKGGKVDEKTPGKGEGAGVNEGAEGKSIKAKKPKRGPWSEDRPWIIKQRDQKKVGGEKEKPKPVAWKDDKQRVRCESHREKLSESFLQVRYHSIQGDSCFTADRAKAFLNLIDRCNKECPEGFVEKSGYNADIIRNFEWLYKSGTEQCLGRKPKAPGP